MCGIVGLMAVGGSDAADIAGRMAETLRHRGPDGGGVQPLGAAAIGMRRLAVVDLEGGRQPMWDRRRQFCVVFNGEVYNAPALRRELVSAGHRFQTSHSDTEVLLHGFQEWGTSLFTKLNGMFALAIWDDVLRTITLARDRFGEKPLYYARVAGGHVFASELRAILAHPSFVARVDTYALADYLAFDYVLAPRTMLSGVRKLPGGHYATLTTDEVRISPYWSLSFSREALSIDEACQTFRELMADSVRQRIVADVPVGLFLSGGLDSSTVGYFMAACSHRVKSFTIAFDDVDFDESCHAARVARHLGIEHHVQHLTERRAAELVPELAEILDEPMGDPSILPTYLLSLFTRRDVTVALGGDGSDELLMGYPMYKLLALSARLELAPAWARRQLTAWARGLPEQMGPVRLRGLPFVQRLDDPMPMRTLTYLSAFHGEGHEVLAPTVRALVMERNGHSPAPAGHSKSEEAIAAYVRGYLQEDILVKVDRASMATSLEVRSPFLDYPLARFLNGLPVEFKLRGARRKYLLTRAMRGYLPDEVIDRSNGGFGIPLERWMRTSLTHLLDEYLDPSRLRRQGIFDDRRVVQLVDDHREGRRRCGRRLWLLLQFQLWYERWIEAHSSCPAEVPLERAR